MSATNSVVDLLTTAERNFVIDNNGKKTEISTFANKTVGIYFSAHWCPPCRNFTPKLAAVYKELKENNKDFEVVFISSDHTENEYKDYLKEMPWLSVPFSDKATKEKLKDHFSVEGIPKLVIMKGSQVLNDSAVSSVSSRKAGGFPWEVSYVCTLEDGGRFLNDKTCILALMESGVSDSLKTEIQAEMKAMAEEKGNEYFFLYQIGQSDMSKRVREYLAITPTPALILTNLKQGQKFLSPDEFKAGVIKSFVAKFKNNQLKPFRKTQERPKNDADPDHPGIKIVTADTFDEIVLDKTKAVFLDVYADWCGPCQTVKPHVLRMAHVLHDMKVSNVVIAKLDCDKNDTDTTYLPESTIPNLKLFVKGNPIKYEGERKGKEMLTFIYNHASNFDLETALNKLKDLEEVETAKQKEEEKKKNDTFQDLLKRGKCTYSLTKQGYMYQSYWFCKTCNKPDIGVCKSCKELCHKGHQFSDEKTGTFFCDCGDGAFDKPCLCLEKL